MNRAIGVVLVVVAVGAVGLHERPSVAKDGAAATGVKPTNPLNAQRAYGYLQEICAIGARPSGSAGMEKQQSLIKEFFEKAGAKVSFQRFRANNPLGGDAVPMANILVEWHPERKERILLCAHYDTRPRPDRDPDPVKQQNGVFLGANDGASGVAVFMELAHLMPKLEGPLGVDFLLVDGEELVYVEGRDPYFLGSTWFARQYVEKPPQHKYRWGVVLDMVGEESLSIYQDRYSASWHESRPLVNAIWATAGRLGVKEFVPRIGYIIQDDHMPLRNTAKIPTCDLIDFADASGASPPGYWHTTRDDPQHCSGSSLAKVGWVVYEWIKVEEAAAQKRADAKPQPASGAPSGEATKP
jgi:glutaminyl-peptide cyclotransferase